MLLRYKSIRGHGFQAAIGRPVWQLLRASLGVGAECFASPLNCHLPAFASAFADVDAAFGSRGSFFALSPLSGSFAANPPFVHPIMNATADHIEKLLTAAEGKHALSFVVFLPGWQEGGGYQQLSKSAFLRAKILVAATDHGFCDGASHQRQDPYRHSPYDTCVFVLQTAKASRKWPTAKPDFEAQLRAAMGKCVPSEAAVGRQLKQTPAAVGAAQPQPPKREPKNPKGEPKNSKRERVTSKSDPRLQRELKRKSKKHLRDETSDATEAATSVAAGAGGESATAASDKPTKARKSRKVRKGEHS
uniref:PCIF1 WW domain-containing protein n=1 Tax=Coccolithus braarudii TaxID=221442 RepID=A0A7S0L1P1_9EUKA